MQYMIKLNSYYYFRVRVPLDLQHFFQIKIISRSLLTKSYNKARGQIKIWQYHFEKLIGKIRMAGLTPHIIKVYINKFLDARLDELEYQRLSRNRPNNSLMDDLDMYSDIIKTYQVALAEGDYSVIQEEISDFIYNTKIEIEPDTIEYKNLARELIRTRIKILQIDEGRAKGDYELFDKHIASKPSESMKPVKLLKPLIEEFISDYKDTKNWNDSVIADYSSTLNLLIEFIGANKDITSITHTQLIEFRNLLKLIPKNRSKLVACKDKNIFELSKLKNLELLSVTSVNKYLAKIISLYIYASNNGYITTNPSNNLFIAVKTKANEEREAYDIQDINRLLSSDTYTTKVKETYISKPEKVFIPLISLLMGMRLNEICQLYIEDIINIDGIYCIDINEKDDKRVKYSSTRIVPIHPLLIKNGFLEYIKSIDKRKTKRVWPNLKYTKEKGYSNSFSKYFQRVNRKDITENKKRVFHSFRHTFINNLKQNQTIPSIISDIVGHSTNSITMNRYGKDYNIPLLYEAISTINYDINLDLKL